MISKDEIETKASEFGLHAANIERDYVFGWLLAGIYGASWLKDVLVLKGGNCFRKAYFPHTRFSNDLDFSSTSLIQEANLAAELNKICDFVQEQTGVCFEKNRNWAREKGNSDKDRRIVEARLYFKDFYGKGTGKHGSVGQTLSAPPPTASLHTPVGSGPDFRSPHREH